MSARVPRGVAAPPSAERERFGKYGKLWRWTHGDKSDCSCARNGVIGVQQPLRELEEADPLLLFGGEASHCLRTRILKFGILREGAPVPGICERAVFVIDKGGKIVFAKTYPLDQLPDLDEVLKTLREINS